MNTELQLLVLSIACAAQFHVQITVTTATDEDDGNALPGNGTDTSPREAILYGGVARILFDSSLNGQTTLT